ncbi:GAF and ANTAR domain-containing protein [Pseudonocardia dioxanivorans]|uniref:GAF and ANTAR domain-containing protein n=1 Tax=Pseudonocardia dioxanivorans TaxID=240495 RepID=UPI001F26DBF3|nr:GAF and ANTAR domain-containing protein [Pseudonocardia dioxanivorans]
MPNIDDDALAASLRGLEPAEDADLSVALKEIVTAAVDLFGTSGAGLMVADEQDTLRYAAATDGPGRVLEEVQSETGQGPCVDTFVDGRPVATDDLAAEQRWPASRDVLVGHGVRAVLGVPVRLGGVVVGSLDVYLDRPHRWDDSEHAALTRYAQVLQMSLRSALAARHTGELVRQLQYALDYRVVIERAVGYVMAARRTDAVTAFDLLRRAARNRRRKVADVAEELLATGRLPGPDRGSG